MRMRQRRVDRLLLRAEAALDAAATDEARSALEEMEHLLPHAEEVAQLRARLNRAPARGAAAVGPIVAPLSPPPLAPRTEPPPAVALPIEPHRPAVALPIEQHQQAVAVPIEQHQQAVAVPIEPQRKRNAWTGRAAVVAFLLAASGLAGWLGVPRRSASSSQSVAAPPPTTQTDVPAQAPDAPAAKPAPDAAPAADVRVAVDEVAAKTAAADPAVPALETAAALPPAGTPVPPPRSTTSIEPSAPVTPAVASQPISEPAAAATPPPLPVATPALERTTPELPPSVPPTAAAPPAAAPTPAATTEPAPAPRPAVPDETGVRSTLAQYESAYSRLDANAAAAVWPGIDRRALTRAFEGLESQRVDLGACDVRIVGETATAECTGSATWKPKVGGGTQSQQRRWQFRLRNSSGAWQIVGANVR
jgi:hypothetical protein